jgi:hypothetical protein
MADTFAVTIPTKQIYFLKKFLYGLFIYPTILQKDIFFEKIPLWQVYCMYLPNNALQKDIFFVTILGCR